MSGTPPPSRSPLSLHDALPISRRAQRRDRRRPPPPAQFRRRPPPHRHRGTVRLRGAIGRPVRPGFARTPPPIGRSEEHTSELQSRGHLVCRLLLEKKKTNCEKQ